MVTKPIRQHMSGKKGAFTLNIVEEKDMSVLNFSRYCEQHRCEYDSLVDIERHFWRTLNSSGNAPFYGMNFYSCNIRLLLLLWYHVLLPHSFMETGADVPGSLFEDEDACGWNVNALDTPMKYLASWPGISSSMLYFGSWRATFAFHTEDFDLYSINYVHTGGVMLQMPSLSVGVTLCVPGITQALPSLGTVYPLARGPSLRAPLRRTSLRKNASARSICGIRRTSYHLRG